MAEDGVVGRMLDVDKAGKFVLYNHVLPVAQLLEVFGTFINGMISDSVNVEWSRLIGLLHDFAKILLDSDIDSIIDKYPWMKSVLQIAIPPGARQGWEKRGAAALEQPEQRWQHEEKIYLWLFDQLMDKETGLDAGAVSMICRTVLHGYFFMEEVGQAMLSIADLCVVPAISQTGRLFFVYDLKNMATRMIYAIDTHPPPSMETSFSAFPRQVALVATMSHCGLRLPARGSTNPRSQGGRRYPIDQPGMVDNARRVADALAMYDIDMQKTIGQQYPSAGAGWRLATTASEGSEYQH